MIHRGNEGRRLGLGPSLVHCAHARLGLDRPRARLRASTALGGAPAWVARLLCWAALVAGWRLQASARRPVLALFYFSFFYWASSGFSSRLVLIGLLAYLGLL